MSAEQTTPETIMAQAQALIDRVKNDLEASDAFYRAQDLDPEKVHSVLEAQLTPQGRQEAQQAFESDMQAVEQEVQEELARASFAAPAKSAKVARRPRLMI